MTPTTTPPALALFRRSVLKRKKWAVLGVAVGPTRGLRCLDIGSDNGVISWLLRERGGSWVSADLDADTVEAIRSLVGPEVVQLFDGAPLPFHDASFDRVVLVDCLEHLQDDGGFVREIARITKPGGEVIFNVPLRKTSWLRRLRLAIGQTDEAHGHVRHGYTADELSELLGASYEVMSQETYSKFFSQAVDTLMTWGIRRLKRRTAPESRKGAFITASDLDRHQASFRLYGFLYPIVWTISQLDRMLWFRSGYMLLVKARVVVSEAASLARVA